VRACGDLDAEASAALAQAVAGRPPRDLHAWAVSMRDRYRTGGDVFEARAYGLLAQWAGVLTANSGGRSGSGPQRDRSTSCDPNSPADPATIAS
jgi:hypothetical protein